MKLDLDQLRELIGLLDESNLTEIEVEQDDDRIRVRRDPAPVVGSCSFAFGSVFRGRKHNASRAVHARSPQTATASYVTSPFVGTLLPRPFSGR